MAVSQSVSHLMDCRDASASKKRGRDDGTGGKVSLLLLKLPQQKKKKKIGKRGRDDGVSGKVSLLLSQSQMLEL